MGYLKYWQPIAASIATALLAFAVHIIILDFKKTVWQSEKEIAVAKEQARCNADRKLTERVENDYQKKLTDLVAERDRLKRVYNNVCVPIAGKAEQHNAKLGRDLNVGSYGLNAEALLDYAADAERLRLQVDSCVAFVDELYKSRGQ